MRLSVQRVGRQAQLRRDLGCGVGPLAGYGLWQLAVQRGAEQIRPGRGTGCEEAVESLEILAAQRRSTKVAPEI